MNILLDTHVFLWAFGDRRRLTPAAKSLLEDPPDILFFSAASAWEIAIKSSKGILDLPDIPSVFIAKAMAEAGLSQLPVNVSDSSRVADLPFHHRDPFDRLLIAQAKANNLRIFTKDRLFRKYDVDIFWI